MGSDLIWFVAAQILECLDGYEGEKVCVGDGGETKLYECE